MFSLNPRFAELGLEFFSQVKPTPLTQRPKLVHLNSELLATLGLDHLSEQNLCDLLSSQSIVSDYPALAAVYMGHQFGHAVPRLGDGRALLIAEHEYAGETWELQLKGAGKTPYSRMGDGRAVLRSSIREYLASHAMQHLLVPTTQALALLGSQDEVYREQVETAAVVLRVAPSFIRFGNFEYFAKHGKIGELEQLVKFVCQNYFQDIELSDANYALVFLDRVVQLSAEMIAHWQSLGFVHGVMNTDNMSILGLTLDYGPFAFMDHYNPSQIFNHSDSEGRYIYANQPNIGWWNLYRLAEALAALNVASDQLEPVLAKYAEYYNQKYIQLMGAKLGLSSFAAADMSFLDELLQIMQAETIDWTYFWRRLSYGEVGQQQLSLDYPSLALELWFGKLNARYQITELTPEIRQERMLATNPALVLRSHLLQFAIERAQQGNYQEIERLFNALTQPFVELAKFNVYYQIAPKSSAQIVLSCSS